MNEDGRAVINHDKAGEASWGNRGYPEQLGQEGNDALYQPQWPLLLSTRGCGKMAGLSAGDHSPRSEEMTNKMSVA